MSPSASSTGRDRARKRRRTYASILYDAYQEARKAMLFTNYVIVPTTGKVKVEILDTDFSKWLERMKKDRETSIEDPKLFYGKKGVFTNASFTRVLKSEIVLISVLEEGAKAFCEHLIESGISAKWRSVRKNDNVLESLPSVGDAR